MSEIEKMPHVPILFRKQTLESLDPGTLGPSSPTKFGEESPIITIGAARRGYDVADKNWTRAVAELNTRLAPVAISFFSSPILS